MNLTEQIKQTYVEATREQYGIDLSAAKWGGAAPLLFERFRWDSNGTDCLWLTGHMTINGVTLEITRWSGDHNHFAISAKKPMGSSDIEITYSPHGTTLDAVLFEAIVFANMVNAAHGIHAAAFPTQEAA